MKALESTFNSTRFRFFLSHQTRLFLTCERCSWKLIFLLHLFGEQVPDALENLAQVFGRKFQLYLAAFDTAHFQNVVDEVSRCWLDMSIFFR